MRFAKLTNNGKVRRAAISPDGKYLAYVQLDGEKQGLWIRQTSSTRSIQVVEPGDMTFQGLTFAPDSNSIYYDVYEGENKNAILYQIPVLGGASRKTLEDVDSSIAFAPDGKHFAFVRNEANRKESSILIADAEGGNERRLTSRPGFPAFSNEGPTWSPDGKLIVCPTRLTNAGQVKMALIFIDAETGEQRPFNTRQWDAIGQVSWLGDGRGLVLTAWDFSASMFQDQLWEVAYPDGEAHMVTNDLNSYHSVSLTAGAPSLVTIQSDRLANFSIMSKTDLDKPRQITSGSGDKPSEMFGMSWTPDNRIVYGSSASGNVDVWIMNADGTNQKQLTAGPYISFKPSASPDGKTIVYVSRRNDVPHLWKMDYDGKDPVQLTNGSAETLPVISPDGSSIVFVTVKEGVPTLWKMPAQGGNAVQLTTQPTTYPAFSPDGKQIACLFRPEVGAYWQVAIFPSNGGVPLKTFKVPATIYYDAGLRWAPDGQSFSYVDNRSGVSNIWSQPLTGESPKPVTSFNSGQIFRFGWSLDGRLLAVEHGVIINDVVLINLA
jgi:Tol biopolymer transport system component